MAAPVPTTIPPRIAAGDTLLFDSSFSDYSSSTWTLSYSFLQVGGIGQFTVTSTASGTGFRTSADTTTWPAGEYIAHGYVTSGSERHRVWTGHLVVDPNLAAIPAGTDTRTRARRILDFIDSSWERIAQKQTVRATIDGIDLFFKTSDDLMKARTYWANIVSTEDAEAGIKGQKRIILAQFTKPV